jgi:hypothetical protein
MRHALRFIPLITGLALACAPDESDYVGDYLDANDATGRAICDCDHDNALVLLFFGTTPYDSVESCKAGIVASSAERGCVIGLFEDESVDYSSVLDCRAQAAARGSACLGGKTCTDTARADCVTTYYDEYNACPDLPNDVEAKLNDCLSN